jgi:hypothetical protein
VGSENLPHAEAKPIERDAAGANGRSIGSNVSSLTKSYLRLPEEHLKESGRTGSATPTEMTAVNAFNDRLVAESHWVFAGGLDSPSTATVIDNRVGEAVFTDGPLLESKEYVAGFSILEAPDLDVALTLAVATYRIGCLGWIQ